MIATNEVHVYNAGHVDGIPLGEGRNIQIGDEAIAIFRTRTGDVYAVQANCPHKGGPLADGVVGGTRVVCPLHAYAFELTTGESVRNMCDALRTYRVSVSSAGDILLTVPAARTSA